MTIIIALLLAPLFILTSCFAAEVLAGLRPLPQSAACGKSARSVIVVPAHDEARIIGSTLPELRKAATSLARILLVADNCTDATAKIAKDLGIEVIERADPDRRGKGFALGFAQQHLHHQPPDVVVVIDADCMTDRKSLEVLIQSCSATARPCQASYVQKPSPQASASVQLSTFAFFIKNTIRQRGLQRLSGRANLLGTGMAFPWSVFALAELSTSSIVEDLKLGQDLVEIGHVPFFVEQAVVWGRAETPENTLSQRNRWEGGFLLNAIRSGPSMLGRSLAKADIRGAWAAVSAMVPPFALLILLDLAGVLLAIGLTWSVGADYWPTFLLGALLLAALAMLALAWLAGGYRFATLRTLSRAPLYVLWKLPMYLAFLRRGFPRDWVRTERE